MIVIPKDKKLISLTDKAIADAELLGHTMTGEYNKERYSVVWRGICENCSEILTVTTEPMYGLPEIMGTVFKKCKWKRRG